jgi:hypothetical protein
MKVSKLCGAKTRKHTSCRRRPMRNGRCANHGGKSLAWFAHPNFKHGRYSKYSTAGVEDRQRRQRAAVARDFQRAVDKLPAGVELTQREGARLLRAVHEAHRRRGWFVFGVSRRL